MFALKKLALSLLTPPGLILLLVLAGLLRLGTGRGRLLLGLAAALLYGLSTAPAVDLLLTPLEGRYPPLSDARPWRPAAVVVLAAGGAELPGVPAAGGLNGTSLARLAEGVRLWRLCQGRAALILTGGRVQGRSVAWLMGETARSHFGVNERSIVLEEQALDTGQSARLLAPRLRGKPFVLVTSAVHMPRSVNDFRAQGLAPLPAPTDYLHSPRPYTFYSFLPSASRLHDAALAGHEWLGLLGQRASALIPWTQPARGAAPQPARGG